MEKTVDLRQVTEAVRQLRDRGERLSRRNVQTMVGRSMTTVHRLLDELLSTERAMSTVQTSIIFDGLVRVIIGEIGGQVHAATGELDLRVAELMAREQEILSGLEGSERRGATLEKKLSDVRAMLSGERGCCGGTAGWLWSIGQVDGRKRQARSAGEAARPGAVKAQLRVERADGRVQELESRIADLPMAVTEAQKIAAVADRHTQDLGERISELVTLVAAQVDALQRSTTAAEQLRQQLAKAHKMAAEADRRTALAERLKKQLPAGMKLHHCSSQYGKTLPPIRLAMPLKIILPDHMRSPC